MKLTVLFATCLSLAVVTQSIPFPHHDKRRFGVEHTPEADATFQEVKDIVQGTDKEADGGNLSGAMVRALLAKAPACDQQDRADEVIDLGKTLGKEKQEQLIKVAKTYRQLERNTPNAGQPSELCKKPPRNKELEGLTQAQDPTGNPKENPKSEDKPKEKPKSEDKPKEKPKSEDKPKGKPKSGDKPKEKPKSEDKPKDNPKGDDDAQNIAETNPVGGVKMPKIVQQDGDFIVNGNGFNGNLDNAHARQCDVQKNLCFNKFNGGDKSFSGQDCEDQVTACKEGPPVFA